MEKRIPILRIEYDGTFKDYVPVGQVIFDTTNNTLYKALVKITPNTPFSTAVAENYVSSISFDKSNLVHLTGEETITGVKDFQNGLKIGTHATIQWNSNNNAIDFNFI